MATEYISREAAICEILSEPTDAHYPSWYAEKLEDIPAADVRPVARGVWVSVHDRYGICSNCHRGDHIDPLAGFCRFCGADMRKRGKDGV